MLILIEVNIDGFWLLVC